MAVFAGPLAPAGWAAFGGRDGLLAVQPYTGTGLVLVSANGSKERRICDPNVCATPTNPRWSSDGQVIALQANLVGSAESPWIDLIYSDGTCEACELGTQLDPDPGDSSGGPVAGSRPAFTPNPTVFSFAWDGSLDESGLDGIAKGTVIPSGVADAVWSAQGELAVVRSGQVWAGEPAHLRLLGAGSSPSWSPGGTQLAFARDGWVFVRPLSARSGHRVVRGGAPAWSPDGTSLAFIAKSHVLEVMRATGGRSRRVGRVRGEAVDWQPIPKKPPVNCHAVPGSMSIAGTTGSVIRSDSSSGPLPDHPVMYTDTAYTGCLRSDGRNRLLETSTYWYDGSNPVPVTVAAGNYAGLVDEGYPHFESPNAGFEIFDLRTGAAAPHLGGEGVSCDGPCGGAMIDQAVLGSDGVSAVHADVAPNCGQGDLVAPCPIDEIIAADSTGVHTLDSEKGQGSLSHLTLTGDTLTWEHDGQPRSAQLVP